MALLLQRGIAHRIDEESLDLTPAFTMKLIDNFLIFGEEIDKFAYDIAHLDQIIRACILLSVYEFLDYSFSRSVSQATSLIFSLIRGGLD